MEMIVCEDVQKFLEVNLKLASQQHGFGTNIQSSWEAKRVGCVWTLLWGSVHMELSMGQLVAYRCMQFIHGHVFIIGGVVSLLKRKHT